MRVGLRPALGLVVKVSAPYGGVIFLGRIRSNDENVAWTCGLSRSTRATPRAVGVMAGISVWPSSMMRAVSKPRSFRYRSIVSKCSESRADITYFA